MKWNNKCNIFQKSINPRKNLPPCQGKRLVQTFTLQLIHTLYTKQQPILSHPQQFSNQQLS